MRLLRRKTRKLEVCGKVRDTERHRERACFHHVLLIQIPPEEMLAFVNCD